MNTTFFTDTITCENCGTKKTTSYKNLNGKMICENCISVLKDKTKTL